MPLSYWSKTVKQNDCSSIFLLFFESANRYLGQKCLLIGRHLLCVIEIG